jgi:YesN/AraC family two-component response regulator
VELSTLSRQVLEQETLQETAELFSRVCRDIHDQLDQPVSGKNAALMDAIKEIIEMNYKEPNLSLQGIAAMLHMTPAYVGRIFKQSEDVSVSAYLNDIRLQHAQNYLETKNISIKQIMELVGYVNESTFFKLFKKAFGVTPKEYRLKRSLE